MLAWWLLIVMTSRFVYELNVARKWLKNYGRSKGELWKWLCSFHFHYQLISYACTSAAVGILLGEVHSQSDHVRRFLGDHAPHELIWFFLGLANGTGILVFARLCFIPWESLGVLSLTIARMLQKDVYRFMMLFVYILFNFFCLLYIVYPRAGAMQLPQVRHPSTRHTYPIGTVAVRRQRWRC